MSAEEPRTCVQKDFVAYGWETIGCKTLSILLSIGPNVLCLCIGSPPKVYYENEKMN